MISASSDDNLAYTPSNASRKRGERNLPSGAASHSAPIALHCSRIHMALGSDASASNKARNVVTTMSPSVALSGENDRTRLDAEFVSVYDAMAKYCDDAGPSSAAEIALAAAHRTCALASHAIGFTILVDMLLICN